MQSLKEVRTRIASVNSTKQITNAMKMVSASKLRKAQNVIIKLRPYALKLQEILQNLSASQEEDDGNVFMNTREEKKILLVVVASTRGLCGAFNTNVIKSTNKLISSKYNEQAKNGNVKLICIGKKVSEYFSRSDKCEVIKQFDDIFNSLTFDNVVPVAEEIMKLFSDKHFDKIEFVYNKFKNAAVQILEIEQFLPIKAPEKNIEQPTSVDYILEPDKENIINEIIPKTLKLQFYKTLLDSFASEHGARMIAMNQATENAIELLKNLKLTYNKARQAAITNEILEIVSGSEALKG